MLDDHFTTYIAKDGVEAIKYAVDKTPDIILSDVEMPNMNGIELSKELASNKKTLHIPVLFISAKNEESDRLIGLLSGAIDYIAKPFRQDRPLQTELFPEPPGPAAQPRGPQLACGPYEPNPSAPHQQ